MKSDQDVTTWGRYQLRLSILLVFATTVTGCLAFTVVFTSATPDFRCRVPEIDGPLDAKLTVAVCTRTTSKEIENGSATNASISLTYFIPREENGTSDEISKCKMYNTSSVIDNSNGKQVVSCQYGYLYCDNEKGSAVTEWDLVCDKAWIKPLSSSSMLLGIVIAAYTTGWLSDRYGRRTIFLVGVYGRLLAAFICALSVSPVMYALMLFLMGYFNITSFSIAVVFASEMLSPRHRTIVVNAQMGSFAAGYMILPVIAYLVPTWRWIFGSLSMIIVLQIPYFWMTPESYRWLVQRGYYERAEKLKSEIRAYNGYRVEESGQMENLVENSSAEDKMEVSREVYQQKSSDEVTFCDLFRRPFIRRRILVCFFTWFTVNVSYFFISLNTSNLGGSSYVNCFLSATVEVPAALASFLFAKHIGRKPAYVLLALISTVALASVPVALPRSTTAVITIAMIGKFAITAAYDVVYLHTPEIFPTLMRSKVLGASISVGNIGSVVSPYIVFLGEQVGVSLPYLIMSGLTALSILLYMFLPETKNAPVPDTIEDAKRMKARLKLPFIRHCTARTEDVVELAG